jgi:hypothetical protein
VRSNKGHFNCAQFVNKFFTRVEKYTRRADLQFGMIVVKIHEGKPASPTVKLKCKPHTIVITRLEENLTGEPLYLLTLRLSRLMKFCNTRFGGLEFTIVDGEVVEAIFYNRVRPDELDVLASFFCPMMKDKPCTGFGS